MAKKYIKNCTGVECGEKGLSKERSSISVLVSRIIFYILLAGFFLVAGYVLFFSPNLQMLNVEITGTRELSSDEIKQKIESVLQKKYIGIVPGNNFLFVSQRKIENILMNDFKKIRSVTVVKTFPDSVSVNIDERKALLVWCSGERCYLLDENGTAYSEADFNSPEFIQNNLLKILDASGREIVVGEKVVESSYEEYALGMKDALGKLKLDTNGEYSTPSRMAEEIRVKTRQGFEIFFSMQFSLESAVNSLGVVFAKEIPENKWGDVEYLDLRNENKVFYKFKNVEPIIENPTIEKTDEKGEEK